MNDKELMKKLYEISPICLKYFDSFYQKDVLFVTELYKINAFMFLFMKKNLELDIDTYLLINPIIFMNTEYQDKI